MGKFRSKLKRHGKGKTWGKGQSATSNPEQMKHRLKAKSRFFQPNLNLAPVAAATPNALTLEAVLKHEQRQAYNAETTTVNDVAGSLKSFKLDDIEDDGMTGTQMGTFKTFQTFASNYSTCSNVSFKKLLCGFRASSDLHKEMLAILSALTEIIRERGGSESSTEYFLLLMEQIEASSEERDTIAGVALLSMGIKSVPPAVLRKRFGPTATTLQTLLQRFIESSSGSQSVIKYLIGCLSVLLRAQDYTTWTYPSTWQYFDAVLSFCIHSKPKLRKAAQHAIASIIHGSYFMLPPSPTEDDADSAPAPVASTTPKHHPVSNRLTKFCLAQFKPELLASAQTTVLHTLTLLKDTLAGLRNEDIRDVCEHLLSIMTAANVFVRTSCFQALHALFVSRSSNLSGTLCAKLLAAIHEYRPDRSDVRQTLAWLTVLKEGHLHLAQLQLELCVPALPRVFEVCTTDLWLSDRSELVVGVSNCIKELLQDCVAPACATPELAEIHRAAIGRCVALLHKVLNAPFGEVTKMVILIFSIVFETCGRQFGPELSPSLVSIAKRYDSQSALRLQIEHTLISGIKALGPELVLRALPLTDAKGQVMLERSWLLPLLREGAYGASFKFFKETIVPLAAACQTKWRDCADKKDTSTAHIYELLCCQLWGLFPGFCRQPQDPEYLRQLAPTIGAALEQNPEFRAPIYDGLLELLDESQSPECHAAIGQYARNFLPRLFNIYTQKPTGTYEADLRKRALDVIRLYVARAPADVQLELFTAAQSQLAATALASFEYDALFDINAAIVRVQKCRGIEAYFQSHMAPILLNDSKSKLVAKDEQKLKKQQRKTYELLRELMTSEQPSCQKFTRKNSNALQQLLQEAFNTSCSVCQASRLYCLKSLLDCRSNLTHSDQLVMKAIPEAVLNYKEFSTRKEPVAEELVKLIATLYQQADKINDFVDILTAGFAGDESLVTNTILAFRAVLSQQGQHLTVSTLEFVLQQVSVFLVQKSRNQAEAAVAFLITFIKVMPIPLVANQLESLMRSLSAMTKDTKRYCRIQIGYLLKKLCKRFSTEELARFVPGDDDVTHRRLKKIRKQMRRDTRKKQSEEGNGDSSDEELVGGVEQKSYTIDDILGDSDSDLPEDMEADNDNEPGKRSKSKSKQARSTYIREDEDEIVDLADLKSIGNVLTSGSADPSSSSKQAKPKDKQPNGGFKTADDGRLIIDDKALRGKGGAKDDSSSDDSSDEAADSGHEPDSGGIGGKPKRAKRGMEDDSSDEEQLQQTAAGKRKRKASDALSMRSGKTNTTRYTAGGKGIHRQLDGGDAVSMKSGYTAKSANKAGSEYSSKKAKGDMKQRGKLDPYAYIPLTRNTLNKRKRAMNTRKFKNVVRGAGGGAGGQAAGPNSQAGRVGKSYK